MQMVAWHDPSYQMDVFERMFSLQLALGIYLQ